MMFTKRLRAGVREGRVTCSIRIWQQPRVKVGGAYAMDNGKIVVDSIREIALGDVTRALARRSGFDDVDDLLAIARHGRGSNIYLIEFHFVGADRA